METIKVSKKEHEQLSRLVKSYDEIYGDPNSTVWNIDDLEELRRIGEEAINIFRNRV